MDLTLVIFRLFTCVYIILCSVLQVVAAPAEGGKSKNDHNK